MALIKCSECGKEVSDKAASCPHCGCPIQSNYGNSYTVTLYFEAMGVAGAFINDAVASITQQFTKTIQENGGKVVNIRNGQITKIPLMSMQTVIIIYEAPKKIFVQTNCTITIQRQSFSLKSDIKFKWKP